mgnify:CR=1 FL=1
MSSVSANHARGVRPASWQIWKQALRLPSFSATLAPIGVGATVATPRS